MANINTPLNMNWGGNWGAPTTSSLMGIDPSVSNPLMFSNGNSPIDGAAPSNWMDAFTKQGAGVPNIGADVPAGLPGNSMNTNWWDGWAGTKEAPGWGGMAMNGISGLASAFMGMKQYGLAKDTLNQHKAEYAANYAAQKTTTNASMADRQAARVASNPGAYQSVGDYMNKNGIT